MWWFILAGCCPLLPGCEVCDHIDGVVARPGARLTRVGVFVRPQGNQSVFHPKSKTHHYGCQYQGERSEIAKVLEHLRSEPIAMNSDRKPDVRSGWWNPCVRNNSVMGDRITYYDSWFPKTGVEMHRPQAAVPPYHQRLTFDAAYVLDDHLCIEVMEERR